MVRIIAGKAKSRRLEVPKGLSTRPTPDRVREALFSMLGAQVQDASVLDVFAGTGALGLEALSRGAAFATFIENDKAALGLLKKNCQIFDAGAYEIFAQPAERALPQLKRQYNLVFIDPPYALNLWPQILALLLRQRLLKPYATVVCEHPCRQTLDGVAGFVLQTSRSFGDVAISLFVEQTI
jgi:16S rRNA (guanine966-N2)-methyltransferase